MPDDKTTVQELKNLVNQFIAERDWFKYHDAKNLAMSIAIEAAELLEHFQWVRNEELDQVLSDPPTRQQIEEELSDILAFVLSFANRHNIDLSESLRKKMAKNAIKYPAQTYRGKYKV
ncbi:MAG: nucleotide pyrophosphohydrolase [Phycisphaerae bacterium]